MRVRKKKEANPTAIVGLGSVHAVAAFAVWYAFAYGFSTATWVIFFVLVLLSGFGMTLGYHRMWTHKSFQCAAPLRYVLAVCGGMALQRELAAWVPVHRVHHLFADQDGDPHSPREYPGMRGLLWAHMFWMFFWYRLPERYRTWPDLDQDPVVAWQKRWYVPIALLGFIIPFLVAGWEGVLCAGFLRFVGVWHVIWSVNSVCHVFGSRARDAEGAVYDRDDSRNNIIIAFLGFGEGNHANHHVFPAWAYHGWKWYSIDPTKWLIQLLALCGLVHGVKKPPRVVRFGKRGLAAVKGVILP